MDKYLLTLFLSKIKYQIKISRPVVRITLIQPWNSFEVFIIICSCWLLQNKEEEESRILNKLISSFRTITLKVSNNFLFVILALYEGNATHGRDSTNNFTGARRCPLSIFSCLFCGHLRRKSSPLHASTLTLTYRFQ